MSIFYKITFMKRFIIPVSLLLFVCAPVRADKRDEALSRALSLDFKREITKFKAGRKVYARLAKAGVPAGGLRVAVRRDPAGAIAFYSDSDNTIYFNSGLLSGFFAMNGADAGALIELLRRDPKARAALVGRADATFLHEMVHAIQYRLYPNYRRDVPEGIPLEFEYEAYMTDTMYTHEKLRGAPELLKAFLKGERNDVYTVAAMNAYLALSMDLDAYKEKIRKVYEDELGGFISLEDAERLQRSPVAQSKIVAYASGRMGEYEDKRASLAKVRAEKEAYAVFFRDYYEKRWPSFSAEALFFIGSSALDAGAYPLALECLAVADVNAVKSGVPQGDLVKLREKGALAILGAAAYIKDNAGTMRLEDLSLHLKALEKACANTGRPFPEALAALRDVTYPKAFRFYSEKAAAEKDPKKAGVYTENAEYFLRAQKDPDGLPE